MSTIYRFDDPGEMRKVTVIKLCMRSDKGTCHNMNHMYMQNNDEKTLDNS